MVGNDGIAFVGYRRRRTRLEGVDLDCKLLGVEWVAVVDRLGMFGKAGTDTVSLRRNRR